MEKLLIIFASLLFTTCVYADTIYMKNGSTINNVVISKRNNEHIFFYTANGSEVVLPKSMIKRIESSIKKNETTIDPTTLPYNKEYFENSTDPKVVAKPNSFGYSFGAERNYPPKYRKSDGTYEAIDTLPVIKTFTYNKEYFENSTDPKVVAKLKAIREGRGHTHYRRSDGTYQAINPSGYQDIRPNPMNCENHMILGNGASMHW